jgi:type III secretory pathway component EscV
MNYTQLIEILKILGTSSIAFIIYLILKEVGVILKNKNGNGRLDKIEQMLTNDYRHEIDNLWIEIRELRECIEKLSKDYSNTVKEIEARLVKLETKKRR